MLLPEVLSKVPPLMVKVPVPSAPALPMPNWPDKSVVLIEPMLLLAPERICVPDPEILRVNPTKVVAAQVPGIALGDAAAEVEGKRRDSAGQASGCSNR